VAVVAILNNRGTWRAINGIILLIHELLCLESRDMNIT